MMLRIELVVVGSLALALSGCHSPAQDNEPVKVLVEGGVQFPQFLVGAWTAQREGWQFVFGTDGKIASAVFSLGRVRVIPGQTTTVPTISGGKSVFKPGQWTVHYAPDTRLLTVRVVLESFRVELGSDVLEGKCTDVFSGAISADGATWSADWTTFPQYTAHTAKYETVLLSGDAVYGITSPIVFQKTPAE